MEKKKQETHSNDEETVLLRAAKRKRQDSSTSEEQKRRRSQRWYNLFLSTYRIYTSYFFFGKPTMFLLGMQLNANESNPA